MVEEVVLVVELKVVLGMVVELGVVAGAVLEDFDDVFVT